MYKLRLERNLIYIFSIYEYSKESFEFFGSRRMDWILSASTNEMKAAPLPNASPILKFSIRE